MELSQCVEAFLAAKHAENLRPKSLASYQREVERVCLTLGLAGVTDADDLTPEHIRGVLSTLLDRGLAAGTVHLIRTITLVWLRWLAREGYVDRRDWAEHIPKIRRDRREGRTLQPTDAGRLLAAAANYGHNDILLRARNLAMISLMLDTGLRAGELARLLVEDVDLVNRDVRVSEECKGRIERVVPFGAETLRHLRRYLRERDGVETDCLWLSVHRNRLVEKRIYDVIRRIGKGAGLKCHPHLLRHTAATLMAHYGMEAVHIQRLLGHRDIQTTLRYLHLSDEDARTAYRRASPVDHLVGQR